MARVKEAVLIVRRVIEKMTYREEYYAIVGMMQMAVMLDRMTLAEHDELTVMLDDKLETLVW